MDFSALLTGLLTQPTFGLPLFVLLVIALLWLIASPRRYPPVAAPRPVLRVMPTDAVSTLYWALAADKLSQPIGYMYQRFVLALRKRYGINPWEIPWREKKARALGISNRKTLTKLDMDLLRLYNVALDFENQSRDSFFGNVVWERRKRSHRQKLEQVIAELGSEMPGIWMGGS